MCPTDERTHYHFNISLRVRHPSIAPAKITGAFDVEPRNSWKAGEERRTPKGTPLPGFNRDTFWVADMTAGRWPADINDAIHDTLKWLVPFRAFLHQLRAESGSAELFIGWFFENQSGEVLTHECLALAGDLKVDLSFDIYPPDQPQHEYDVESPIVHRP